MNKLRSKLASKRGASLILALVAVAICLTVGASILMSASATYDSLKSREKGEAARLAVSSAAGVVEDLFEDQGSMTVTYTAYTGDCQCSHVNKWDGTAADSGLAKTIQSLSLSALNGTGSTKNLTMQLDNGLLVYVSLKVKLDPDSKGTVEEPFVMKAAAELWTGSTTNKENPVSMNFTGYFLGKTPSVTTETCATCSKELTETVTEYELVWAAKYATNEVS